MAGHDQIGTEGPSTPGQLADREAENLGVEQGHLVALIKQGTTDRQQTQGDDLFAGPIPAGNGPVGPVNTNSMALGGLINKTRIRLHWGSALDSILGVETELPRVLEGAPPQGMIDLEIDPE